MANILSIDKKVAVISALVEGCSINSIVRMTGVAKWTILRLLASTGAACSDFQNAVLVNLPPDLDHISTSYIERQNLTMRMSMRRYTRLTNGFSKKLENHIHMVNLFYMWYNFCRVHQTLRVTPAMQAGLSSHVWSIQELVALTTESQLLQAA